MKVVPVPGNPALDRKDRTNPPDWARYEVRLRGKTSPGPGYDTEEAADSLAKWLYGVIGSSSVPGNKWQVDWVLYTHAAWGRNWPVGNAIFMLRFEDPADGVAAQLALSDSNDFDLNDSYPLTVTEV
jgi:hypothetical protein